MEAATSVHRVPHQPRGQPVHRGGQGGDLMSGAHLMNHKQNIDLASLVLAEQLHLMDHVVSPRGGVEILSPNHHQNILTALGKPFTTFY